MYDILDIMEWLWYTIATEKNNCNRTEVRTMSAILETLMLVCFGLSWPVNVLKNVKARSAKNMSLPFILLICLGYVAGITAKLLSGSITYVLAVYIINLAIVSVNLVVYVINRRYDKVRVSSASSI